MARKPSVRRFTTQAKTISEPLGIVPPVLKSVAAMDAAVTIKTAVDRIKEQLAKHGINISIPGDQGTGNGFSLTIGQAPSLSQSDEVTGAVRSDAEIATQQNAPLVIKLSGPITIDIGAIIMNSND